MITLQFSTQTGVASRIIRYLTWSKYSHVDVVMPNGHLLGARFENGVQIRSDNYTEFALKTRFTVLPKIEAAMNVEAFYKFLQTQVGKPYDWRGIFNFAFQGSRDWQEEDSWFCSELVASAFVKAGVPLLKLQECDRVSPRDLTLSVFLKEIV